VSIALAPPRLPRCRRSEAPGLAMICRARKIVATLGGRFSLELGIDLDRDPEEVERWGLAATLFGNRISTAAAIRTYRVLEHAGVRTIEDAGRRGRYDLIALLDEGGYVRGHERTASRLQALAEVIAVRYDGRLATLGEEVVDCAELARSLRSLPGWGPVTVRALLRELRGVWPGANVMLDHQAADAALHVHLPVGTQPLSSLAAAAHLDFRDLEAGLVRLALAHDLVGCPGGEECPLAAFDPDQFVHY
jgi:hypothetical protein